MASSRAPQNASIAGAKTIAAATNNPTASRHNDNNAMQPTSVPSLSGEGAQLLRTGPFYRVREAIGGSA
jgi:hypothetical protein